MKLCGHRRAKVKDRFRKMITQVMKALTMKSCLQELDKKNPEINQRVPKRALRHDKRMYLT